MNKSPNMPEIEPGIPNHHAVSVYEDTPDDFPVLKAFQRYIDAEQEKARKRMLSLSIFFGCLMTAVIAFFIFMLNGISERNQALNDRLIEYAIKDRDRQAAVVVQPPADNSALLALTAKLDDLQKKLNDAQQQASDAARQRAEAAAEAAAQAAKDQETAKLELEKIRTKEALEVERLKALLQAEREKAAAEREKKRELELEAYRRTHYPEFYEKKEKVTKKQQAPALEKDPIDEVLEELASDGAISYFDDEDEEDDVKEVPVKTPPKKDYAIPVEVKGVRGKWRVPTE